MTTVLVVDDNPLDLKMAGKWVELAGWSAEYAENGRAALEKIERHQPDLVLTDLQMPEMDGLELVRKINAQYPAIPVVLITAYGSEEIAVIALKVGAASYVPKRNLNRDLQATLQRVLESSATRRGRLQLFEFMTATQSQFTLGNEDVGPPALVSYCHDAMDMLKLCRPAAMLQVGTALSEALRNAIDHGNLELSSALREADDGSYEALRQKRRKEPPYCNRRVHVETSISREELKYVIRDEGPGFDPTTLPDPTDPENLLKPSGRGIILIRTFMDDVMFNDRGNEVTLIRRFMESR